ncbi:aminotransferase class I/II-fold pyridoxal phosphate-dependent enzyme [Enterococcus sp. ALS3]|uniref:Aminotransferase class I/II-fold pyridoxal phosphate-dependent enzyme n=1 Tax=Enterococcus alishanensis TaxID=1303817 RepID=A0ABS6TDB9_9ENTE|nr:aminotransferase class I/II-fold pyridoxal phosphate-dependent enzyme [Enterococcus alishanensis]MBV7390898.1 aminotransferase class I/II-fold pyridoxal phosphate-dependent enzyme [Enterococcus alishanensis]
MRDFLAKRMTNIKPSGIRKFFDIVSEQPDAISLGVGEPDFDTPRQMTEVAINSLREGRTFYTANAGLLPLRKRINDYLNERVGVNYQPESEIIVTVGGSEAIDLAFRVFLDPGDEVIIPEPSFVCYKPITELVGGKAVTIDLQMENQFQLTAEELEAAITPKSKILMLSYPNNPTGAIMPKEALIKIADVVKKHDLLVVSDEIYAELIYDGSFVSIASLPGMRERTIVINGFSKAFAMTGWRLGFVAGPEIFIQEMLKVHQYTIMAAPTASQYAALEGLKDWHDTVENMRLSYEERRNYLHHALTNMGLPCYKAEGAFYLFPQISQFGLSSEDFAIRLLEEEKLAVVPGSAFGESGEGYLRLSYAYSLDELKEAIRRLEKFIQKINH